MMHLLDRNKNCSENTTISNVRLAPGLRRITSKQCKQHTYRLLQQQQLLAKFFLIHFLFCASWCPIKREISQPKNGFVSYSPHVLGMYVSIGRRKWMMMMHWINFIQTGWLGLHTYVRVCTCVRSFVFLLPHVSEITHTHHEEINFYIFAYHTADLLLIKKINRLINHIREMRWNHFTSEVYFLLWKIFLLFTWLLRSILVW